MLLRFFIALNAIIAVFFTIYSYFLLDPNLTFTRTDWWESFRNWAVNIGYHNTQLSLILYISFVILLFISHLYFIKNYKKINLWILILPLMLFGIFSYPFLSHDLFSYMFDAKIVTQYHQNPYELMPGFFYDDPWLRFTQWTERRYPYGPTFLPLTLIPSFLGFGKFLPTFLLFKFTYLFLFLISAYLLYKLNKKWAVIFVTHPLILIEGLVNAHLDFIALTFGVIGVFFLLKDKRILSRIFLLLSGGIKYTTLPMVFLSKAGNSIINKAVFVLFLGIVSYVILGFGVQPWYFLPLFIFLPFYEKLLNSLNIFFAGLLLSYYPYVKAAGWSNPVSITIKNYIIAVFFVVNLTYLVYRFILLPKVKPVR